MCFRICWSTSCSLFFFMLSNLGYLNLVSVVCAWAIIKQIRFSAGYNAMINDQTVLGIDFVDCAHQI